MARKTSKTVKTAKRGDQANAIRALLSRKAGATTKEIAAVAPWVKSASYAASLYCPAGKYYEPVARSTGEPAYRFCN